MSQIVGGIEKTFKEDCNEYILCLVDGKNLNGHCPWLLYSSSYFFFFHISLFPIVAVKCRVRGYRLNLLCMEPCRLKTIYWRSRAGSILHLPLGPGPCRTETTSAVSCLLNLPCNRRSACTQAPSVVGTRTNACPVDLSHHLGRLDTRLGIEALL